MLVRKFVEQVISKEVRTKEEASIWEEYEEISYIVGISISITQYRCDAWQRNKPDADPVLFDDLLSWEEFEQWYEENKNENTQPI